MRWFRLLTPLSLILFLGCTAAIPAGTAAIETEELEAHMRYLAADGRVGRFPGTQGITEAEEYIADRFAELGLQSPPGFRGYFDPFALQGHPWDLDSYMQVEGVRYSMGTDFAPLVLSGEGTIAAPAVFVGYGIEAPEYDHADYRGLDVEGKIVVALRHEPEETDPGSRWNGTEFSEHATFLSKARLARSRGAAAFLTFTDPLHHEPEESFHILHSLELDREGDGDVLGDDFPALLISRELAGKILAPILTRSGLSLEELQRLSETGRTDIDAALPEVLIDLKRRAGEPIEARNVGGLYVPPGGGDGTVIVGAHHDHLGGTLSAGEEGVDAVFNGADDNASGVTALLEIAEEVALTRPETPWSILFVTFSAEEEGLLGSRSLSSRLPRELAPWRMMINLDMVGRNPGRPLEIYQAGVEAGELDRLRRLAEDLGLQLAVKEDTGPGLSSHYPFRRRGIPTLFLFTGFHPDYHQVDDEPDAIDYERLKAAARLTSGFLISER